MQMTEGVETWRERILHPWKFNRVKHNDAELQKQVRPAHTRPRTDMPAQNWGWPCMRAHFP